MVDALRDLGEPVIDRTLVFNLLRGLNGRSEAIGLHLRRGRPFPSFLQAINDLLLEEHTMADSAPAPSAIALHTGTAPSSPATPAASSQQQPPSSSQPPANLGGSRGKLGKCGSHGSPAAGTVANAAPGGPLSGQLWPNAPAVDWVH
ncbi:uncharacterized protein [Miscanthus floridulus]|uniref:uncharacterized protein n=1 Tax=Miscanthus floridulus TaxID=154761 RepID=UPI00345AB707